ncbi:hypothetical protein [Nocardioides marmoraquaticus]
MRLARPLALASGVALAAAAAVAAPGSAQAAPTWAPADEAAVHPGVQMYADGGQCTGNFVFTDASGNVYVGYAAHCAASGEATDTDGCQTDALPLGTRVSFQEMGNVVTGGTEVASGTLAYSSWEAMDRVGTTDADTCAYNDFALVKVSGADKGKVNPSIPFWGGPSGIDTDGTAAGEQVFSFGNSSLRGGIEVLSPKTGGSLGTSGGGWTHSVYTVTPGVPGDSGSAFLSADGEALGTLSTLALAPLPASNGVGDLSRELAFAQQHSGIPGLQLARGTEPFRAIP